MNISTRILVREPEGLSVTVRGANSNLLNIVGECLKFQKKDVGLYNFTCKSVFYRPEYIQTVISVLQYQYNKTSQKIQTSCQELFKFGMYHPCE